MNKPSLLRYVLGNLNDSSLLRDHEDFSKWREAHALADKKIVEYCTIYSTDDINVLRSILDNFRRPLSECSHLSFNFYDVYLAIKDPKKLKSDLADYPAKALDIYADAANFLISRGRATEMIKSFEVIIKEQIKSPRPYFNADYFSDAMFKLAKAKKDIFPAGFYYEIGRFDVPKNIVIFSDVRLVGEGVLVKTGNYANEEGCPHGEYNFTVGIKKEKDFTVSPYWINWSGATSTQVDPMVRKLIKEDSFLYSYPR